MTPLINPFIEQSPRENILPELSQGRKNFDLNHTKAVVHWMKKLLLQKGSPYAADTQAMVTAAYAHDWGYAGLFKGTSSDVIPKRLPNESYYTWNMGPKRLSNLSRKNS